MSDLHGFDGPGPSRLGWVLRARQLLQESAEALDQESLALLAQARRQALDSLAPRAAASVPQRSSWARRLGVAALVVGVSLLAGRALWPVPDPPAPRTQIEMSGSASPVVVAPVEPVLAAPDFELLDAVPDPQLLEDLEFYLWLEQREPGARRDG